MHSYKNNGANIYSAGRYYKDKERYYYVEVCKRFRIFDTSQKCGTDYICIADTISESFARKKTVEMNLKGGKK